MVLLDEVTGHEFEEVMQTVFRKLGYKNVQVSTKTGDKGRDIIMEEVLDDGSRTTVIVECKHKQSVGRPVIQKLHSAVETYDSVSQKKGMVVTTGRFSSPATEYAEQVDIELLDGSDLRDIAEEVGMDLYNGRFDIICDDMLDPSHPEGVTEPFLQAFDDVSGITRADIPAATTTLTLYPILKAQTYIDRTFETSVGVIHRIEDSSEYTVDASTRDITQASGPVRGLIQNHRQRYATVNETDLSNTFDDVQQRRFECTETEYRDWLRQREVEGRTEVVTYTGDNNVEYEKTCEPDEDDVEIREFDPVYVPRIYANINLDGYTYSMDWFANGDTIAVTDDKVRDCVHCEGGFVTHIETTKDIVREVAKQAGFPQYTYCEHCSGIVCRVHTARDTLTGEPFCRECGTSTRIAGAKKYFIDKGHQDEYEQQYDQQESYKKPFVNKVGTAAVVLLVILLLVAMALTI